MKTGTDLSLEMNTEKTKDVQVGIAYSLSWPLVIGGFAACTAYAIQERI